MTRGIIRPLIIAMLSVIAFTPGVVQASLSTNSNGLTRTDNELQSVFDKESSNINQIYNRELGHKPTLKGKIVFSIVIQPSGVVSECKIIGSTVNDNEFERKEIEFIKTINFGPSRSQAIKITYPVEFILESSKNKMKTSLKDDEYIAKKVISQMLKNVPESVEKICVIKQAGLGTDHYSQQLLKLDGVDKRIVSDKKSCSIAKNSKKEIIITFSKEFMNLKGFEKYGDYFVIDASISKCGAEEHAFVFKKYSDGVRFVGHKVIGDLKCINITK